MYVEIEDEFIARVPPDKLGLDYDNALLGVAKTSLEGILRDAEVASYGVSKRCFVISVSSIEKIGEGTIVHGDGAVYQTLRFRAIGYMPEMQEIVEGYVTSVQKFGAFVRFGPFEGLLHISQIMDDRIDIDLANQRFIGKDTKRDLKMGDRVRVKIVALSLPSSFIGDSKVGLTMKQLGLGKLDWLRKRKENRVENEA